MKSRLQLSVSCFVVGLAFALSAATYSSQSYSRSGLIGQWDGVENAGVRKYDATATKWKDLAGTIGDFAITTTVAGFTENGLKKTASGVMAKVARPNAEIKTVEVVLSGIPSKGWVNAFFMDHSNGGNITITVRNSENGGATEPRQYFFDKGSHGLSTSEKPESQTLTAIFDSDKLKDNSLFFCNGMRPTGNPYGNTWYSSGSDIQLGGRAGYSTSGDATTKGYTIHAIRIYNRELTEAEIARHAKIDQVRFFGASDVDDGMSYISDGLMGWWDGVDNVGTGQHDPNATAWKDLSGANAGDFLVQSKTASFTANGLKKTAKGFCATNAVVHHGVLTMESVVSGVPASGWVHPVFLSPDQTITFRNENNGTRTAFFDYDKFKWSVPERTDPLTVTVSYEKDEKAVGLSFYLNGAPSQGVKSTASGMYWAGKRISSIGGRSDYPESGDSTTFGYTVHSIRLYDRVLAQAEAAYNAAVDQCRLFGRPVGDGFAYRITDEDAIECQLRAWTYGLGGMVKMESGDSVADYVATEWVSFGTEQTATFTAVPAEDCVFLGWTGDVEAITSGTASDLTVTVSSKKGVALQAVFTLPTTGEYVTDGLIGWWDGKENAGYGHHDLAATTWKDLTGVTGDFELTDGVASFTADGLKKVAKGVMAKAMRPNETIGTVEAVVSELPAGDSWANVFFANHPKDGYKNITISVNNRGSGKAREYFFDYGHNGWTTGDKPEALTIAAIFNANATALRDANSSFCNGARLSGTFKSNTWDDSTDSSIIQLGGRWGDKWKDAGDAKGVGYTIHAIRIYSRELTAGEIRRNAKRDAIRFFGAKPDGLTIIVR